MANLNFKWGSHDNLAKMTTSEVGSVYFTKDEGSLYLGVDATKAPKRIQGVVQFYESTTAFAEATKPPYSADVIYYIADQSALIRWDDSAKKFLVINVTAAEFTAKAAELSGSIVANANSISGLRNEVGTKGADEKVAFVWLRDLQNAVNALNELTGIGDGEGESLTEQIAALVGRLDDEGGLVDRIEALESWKTDAAADILDHEGRVTILETNMGTRADGEAAVYPWLNSLQDSVDNHETRLDAIDGESGSIATINGRIDGLASRTTEVENKAKANAEDIVKLKAADTTTNAAIEALQGEDGLAGVKSRLTPLEAAKTDHETRIQNLENADTEIKADVKAINDALPTIRQDILNAANSAAAANNAIGDANTAGTVKYDIAQLQAKDTLVDADIEALEDRVKANEDAIGNDETANSIKGRLKATETVANQAKADIVTINNTLSSKADQSTVNGLTTKVGNLEIAVGAPKSGSTAASGLYAETANNAAAIDLINQNIGTKGVAGSTVYGAIKEVSDDLAGTKNTLSGASSVANEAKASAKTANDAIGDADTEGTIKYEIAELKKVDAAQATTNQGFENRIKAAEDTIKTHGTDITNLKNAASTYAKQTDLEKEIEDREAADTQLRTDLNAEIARKINAANSLTYIDGISTADEWDAVKAKDAHIGDTYVVADSNLALNLDLDNNSATATVKCYAGDLLIATAKENATETDGVLAAADIEWVHVQSGYKAELQGKLSVADIDGTASANINLTSLNGNGTVGDLGQITVSSASPNLTIEASGNTMTINMVWGEF